MRGIRVAWMVLALAAAAFTVSKALGTAASASLGCAKVGALHLERVPAGATCESPMYHVIGVWPLVLLGLALAGPPAFAAFALRTRASWLAVVVVGVVAILGVVHWAEFWGALMFAIPLLLASLVVTLLQLVVAQSDAGRTADPRYAKL